MYNLKVSLEEYGEVKTYMLKPCGDSVPVTNSNRREYVNLYLDWVLNTAIYEQFRAFYLGFHSVCASNALIVSILLNFHKKHTTFLFNGLFLDFFLTN